MRFPYTVQETSPGSGRAVLHCVLPGGLVDVVYTGKAEPRILKRFSAAVYKAISAAYFGTNQMIPTFVNNTEVDVQWLTLEHEQWLTIVGHNALLRAEMFSGTNELESKFSHEVDSLLGPAITAANDAIAKLIATARSNMAELQQMKEENRNNINLARNHGYASIHHAISQIQHIKDSYTRVKEAMAKLDADAETSEYSRIALLERITELTTQLQDQGNRMTFLTESLTSIGKLIKIEEEYCYSHEAACRKRGDTERADRHHVRGLRLTAIYQQIEGALH